eukprot:jgi/Ulvmu1/923/UM102_0006.1
MYGGIGDNGGAAGCPSGCLLGGLQVHAATHGAGMPLATILPPPVTACRDCRWRSGSTDTMKAPHGAAEGLPLRAVHDNYGHMRGPQVQAMHVAHGRHAWAAMKPRTVMAAAPSAKRALA